MKVEEVHKLSDEEIAVEVDRLRKSLFDLKSQAVTEKIDDPSQLMKIRRDVARLLTERSARRHGLARQEGGSSEKKTSGGTRKPRSRTAKKVKA
jgi:large subunit ribosomal protein L29